MLLVGVQVKVWFFIPKSCFRSPDVTVPPGVNNCTRKYVPEKQQKGNILVIVYIDIPYPNVLCSYCPKERFTVLS